MDKKRHYQGYIIIKKRFVKKLSWSKFQCVKECKANYMNTWARRESDCTFSAGLRSWMHTISFKPTKTGLLQDSHSQGTAATSMACSSSCLIAYTCYRHLRRISRKCERLREFFPKLRCPNHLIDSVINRFITSRVAVDGWRYPDSYPLKRWSGCCRVFKTTTLRDLSSKVQKTIQPVFTC